MSVPCSALSFPSPDEVRREYASRGAFRYLVPGGGHGAAAVCRALLARGYRVAGVANPIDEGGHSARIRWDVYRHTGYWPIIPGDTMNLLGGGFCPPEVYAVTNSRLAKEPNRSAGELFAELAGSALAGAPEAGRRDLEAFARWLEAMGEVIQERLIAPGITPLPGASLQNLLHVGVMFHTGAYRRGIEEVDQGRYLSGSYLLEREMRADPNGLVCPMSFDKVTLVTRHAGGRTVVGGINRVLLAKGDGPNGLEYGEMVPNAMLPNAPPESDEEGARKCASAKIVDWYPAEVRHGPTDEPFSDDWVFEEIRPRAPRINPFLVEIMRALEPGGAIIIPPGNAHESTYTFFVMDRVWEELRAAKERGVLVVLVLNPVNLLLTAGYAVDDYLGAIEQALRHATGRGDISAEQVIDRIVVNDPSGAPERAQRMMRGEGIPPEVKQVLLHRTPTGPVTVSEQDIARLQARGFEVVSRPMLSVETVSIRGIETEAISYERDKLLDAILSPAG